MPEGNPLVAESKKDGDGLFVAGNGDYGWAGGTNLSESAMDAFNGIASGDWISGGLGMLSLAGEVASAAVDPFGYLMSSVASFLMEHVKPLKDMLDSIAGNPPVIQSYSETWANVSKALAERKTDLDNAVKNGTTGWTGQAADAYRKQAAEHGEALTAASSVAGGISTAVMIFGQVVAFVRTTVRQLISDLVGKLISWVMEEVFSLGFGTPVVVAQATAAIAKWGEKISGLLKKLTDAIRKISPLLSKLMDIFEKIAKIFGKVLGKVSGLDGVHVKEGGFVHRIPKEEGGGVHARAHSGSEGEGSHGSDGKTSSADSGKPSHPDGESPSSDPMNTDSGSRRSSSRDGDSSPSAHGEDGAPSHSGDGTPSAHTGGETPDGSPSAVRSGDNAPHTRAGESAPSRAGDGTPAHTGESAPAHVDDSRPSPTRAEDSAPSPTRTGDSNPSRPHAEDDAPPRAGDPSPSPNRAEDSSPSHTGDNAPSRTGDPSPSPTRAEDNAPSRAGDASPSEARTGDTPTHSGDGAPSHAADTAGSHADGGSPARSDVPGSHAGGDTPSSAAPPRTDGATTASGTAPTAPRTGDPGTFPSPRGGDGAASGVPPQGGAPMMGGGMPPGGGHGGGGGLGGGSPRTGGGAGWTGTPGSPGARPPHVDAPRPRTGGDLPAGRPRTPEAPAPAARGFGPGTHGADTHAPSARPGADGHPHESGAGHHNEDGGAPHEGDTRPLPPDEVNARHSESTQSGSSYHAGDAELGDLPHRVKPDPDGRYTVDVHVTPDGHARIGDRLYTPEEFADILRHNAGYDGRPIRLIGCDAGSNGFAQRLSHELDTEVLAPSKPAWTDAHGRVFSTDYEIGPDGRMHPRIPPDGEWSVHHPDGSTHRAGDDGFAPDAHHHDPHDVDAESARHRGDGDDLNPQHQIEGRWHEPTNFTPPGEDVHLGADESFFDHHPTLEPNTRYNVYDPDGNVRTRVYTDEHGNVSHVDAHAPNTLHGGNPEVAHPVPNADYRVQVGNRHDIYPTGPDGHVRTVTSEDVQTVHGKQNVTRTDYVETPPEPARHEHIGKDHPLSPGATEPFGIRDDLEPNTRYHVTDAEGHPRGSFQTDGERKVRWVDTHEGTPGRPNPDLEHPVPNGNYRVDRGPNYQEYHVGADGRPEHAATWRQPKTSGEAVVHQGAVRQNEPYNRQGHGENGNPPLEGEREHRVTDKHGQERGSFYTNDEGSITHVDTTTGQRARTNPEIANAPEGAHVTQDGFYGTGKAKNVQDSWPRPDREVVFSHQKKGGGFLDGDPGGWSDQQVKAVTDPVSGKHGTPLVNRTDLPPNTRIHIVDDEGFPYSTVQTGPDGKVTHVHTFQPTNPDLNYPPPGAVVRVDHGLQVHNPDGSVRITEGDVHRTDSRGNTVATSGPPDAAGASQIRRDTTAQSEVGALGGKGPGNRNIDDGGHHGGTAIGKGGEAINQSTQGRIDNSNAGAKDVEGTYDTDDSWYQLERTRDENLDLVDHEDIMPARDPGIDDPHTRYYRSYGVDEQGRITVNVRSFPGDHNTPLWPRDFRR